MCTDFVCQDENISYITSLSINIFQSYCWENQQQLILAICVRELYELSRAISTHPFHCRTSGVWRHIYIMAKLNKYFCDQTSLPSYTAINKNLLQNRILSNLMEKCISRPDSTQKMQVLCTWKKKKNDRKHLFSYCDRQLTFLSLNKRINFSSREKLACNGVYCFTKQPLRYFRIQYRET